MSIEDRKAREKQELRMKIIDAAEELFAEGGHQNASIRKIADAVDYSPASIFNIFRNKEEILRAIADRAQLELSSDFKSISGNAKLNALDKLKALITAYVDFGLNNKNVYRLYAKVCDLEVRDNALYETIGGKPYRIFSSWQTQVDDLMGEGKIRKEKSVSLVLLIFYAVDGFIMSAINFPQLSPHPVEESVSRVLDMVFHGLLIETTK